MKLLVINNLASGYGDGSIYDYLRALAADGDQFLIRNTDGTTNITTLLDDATDFDVVVASGGDGTIATVANELAHTGIPLLPFPAGTANLLAMNLLSPTETHALAKMTRAMKTLDFDLGEMSFPDGDRFGFSIIAGAGYDATIMESAKQAKKLLGPLAYFTAAFTNPTPQYSHFKLGIDGKTIESDGLGVLISNFSKIQFDIAVVHENQPRDGIFDVVILKAENAFGLIPDFLASILDRDGDYPARSDALEFYRGHTITVEADPPLNVQYDGEAIPKTTPFTATMLPSAARFIVSEECLNHYGDPHQARLL